VPAFYIIGIKEPVPSIADVSEDTAALLGIVMHIVRKAMKEALGVKRVNIYLEEKLKNPHYHTWLLPMWDDVLKSNNIQPRIWESNIMKYIKLFKFEAEGEKILQYNKLMREHLERNYLYPGSVLSKNNFM
jgi:diadenosine tetraphosphate (Ap4A) HIT family hydrolase